MILKIHAMKKKPVPLAIIILSLCILVFSCSKEYSASGIAKAPVEDSFNLTIRFSPMVDTLKLDFDSVYTNYWKEKYSVSAFKFYVSKFDLINTDSNRTYHLNSNKYFLVDASDSSTWMVKLLAPAFNYNRISFLIGVDSLRNVSGTQTGALDPARGMYWSATAGYIMAKLEGSSPVSPSNKIQYQIGGFSGDSSVLRKPTLLFPYGQTLQVSAIPGHKSMVDIDADVNAWFFNPHQIKIKDNPSCVSPGPMAVDISENYSKMFNVKAVINN